MRPIVIDTEVFNKANHDMLMHIDVGKLEKYDVESASALNMVPVFVSPLLQI